MRHHSSGISAVVLVALLLGAFAVASIPVASATHTLRIASDADAQVRIASPTSSFGSATASDVREGIGNTFHRILFHWDLSVLPTETFTVDSVTLELEDQGQSDIFDVGFHELTSAFVESTVTWNTQPTFDATPDFTISTTNQATGVIVSFDFLSLFTKMRAGANDGVVMKAVNEGGIVNANISTYAMRELVPLGGTAPTLVVVLTTASELALIQIISVFPLVIVLAVLGVAVLGAAASFGQGSEWAKWLVLIYVVALIVVTLIMTSLLLAVT